MVLSCRRRTDQTLHMCTSHRERARGEERKGNTVRRDGAMVAGSQVRSPVGSSSPVGSEDKSGSRQQTGYTKDKMRGTHCMSLAACWAELE